MVNIEVRGAYVDFATIFDFSPAPTHPNYRSGSKAFGDITSVRPWCQTVAQRPVMPNSGSTAHVTGPADAGAVVAPQYV